MNSTHIILGTGQLGMALMEQLTAQGKTVLMVNRSGKTPETLPTTARIMRGDVTSPQEVTAICQGAEVVFHCAQPAYTEWPEKFPPITKGIVEGVARTNAKLIFGDNLYMYGSTNGQPIHENLPYAATGHKGRTRAHMAEMLLAAHQAGKVRVAIGRASDFYGPRVTGSALGDMFFEAALAGKPVNLMGNIDLPHTYTYIGDFARALMTLSEKEGALGQVWHVPSAETITTRQFVQLVEQEIGRSIKLRVAGKWLISLVGLFQPMVREMKEMMYEFEEPYVVEDGRFRQTFGSHTTPHPQAIRETVAWYRQQMMRKTGIPHKVIQ